MWKYWKLSVLLVCLSLQPCYSLSQEEVESLPTLSKSELIEIIMIYDHTLNQIETENEKSKILLNEREIDLTQRESRASEREASFQMRESLLVESLKIRKELERSNFWKGFGFGGISGLVVGGVAGGYIGNHLP